MQGSHPFKFKFKLFIICILLKRQKSHLLGVTKDHANL